MLIPQSALSPEGNFPLKLVISVYLRAETLHSALLVCIYAFSTSMAVSGQTTANAFGPKSPGPCRSVIKRTAASSLNRFGCSRFRRQSFIVSLHPRLPEPDSGIRTAG
jgi:hypothetical protein